MTKLAEKKILSKLNRIENILTIILSRVGIDNQMDDSQMITELEKRAKAAETDFQAGKLQTAEEVFSELKDKRSKCIK